MRAIADAGYRGHACPPHHDIRICVAGQKRRVTDQIKRRMRRPSAIEPVIGRMQTEHRITRNHLKGTEGDPINAVLSAVGYNVRRLPACHSTLLAMWTALVACTLSVREPPQPT